MEAQLWSCEERDESEIGTVMRLYVVVAETEEAARTELWGLGVKGRAKLTLHPSSRAAAFALWTGLSSPAPVLPVDQRPKARTIWTGDTYLCSFSGRTSEDGSLGLDQCCREHRHFSFVHWPDGGKRFPEEG